MKALFCRLALPTLLGLNAARTLLAQQAAPDAYHASLQREMSGRYKLPSATPLIGASEGDIAQAFTVFGPAAQNATKEVLGVAGQSRDRTILRLRDSTFTDAKAPRPVLSFGPHGSADWFSTRSRTFPSTRGAAIRPEGARRHRLAVLLQQPGLRPRRGDSFK